jgi:PAS domain-containing protein
MVAWPLIGFLLHTIGWIIPLSLLFDAGMRFTRDGESPVGLRRIFLGGMLVLLALLFSILYLTVFLVPSIELHLISHSTILVGFILALSGARRALASFIHRETPGRKQTVARQPFFAIPTLLVLLVIAEGLVSRAEPVWLLDRALYALNLSLLAALYTSFGMLTKREAGSSVSTVLSVVAAASALLVIAAHSLMIMDVSPALKAIAQIGRGALLALGAVAVFIAYRLWLARPAGSPSADSVLLTPKLRLQQRLALFITVGTVLFAAGTVLMSTMTRSSIQTVEQTYIHNQERVAHAVARNFESLTADLATTLSRFAEHPAVQRIRIDSLRFLFSRQHLRWQQVVSSFSRVDEHGVLRYTYPEVVSSIGADLTFQEHVRHFLRTRQITLSGVFTAVQGFNAIALYVPVFTKGSSNDSVFAGGVALLMHTDAFSERVFRNVQYLNPNPVAAINLAGNIIASSDSGEVRSSAQEYLQAVYPVRIPDDTAASIVRRALELDTPSVLPLVVGEALAAQRWIISYPIHLQGTRLGSILLPIRQVDVVSFYRSSIAQQVAWWMVLTALLMFTMGSIVVVVYRWAVYLESEVKRTVALVREREERLQTIVDSEPECVEILDAEGCILEMNRAGLQMIEADSSAAVQGKSV